MNVNRILKAAEDGTHFGCRGCPWNPGLLIDRIAFGKSCCEHGLDWSSLQATAVSMQIVQDPAGTTPDKTRKLCSVCNSRNQTDRTAQHSFDLWKAAVAPVDGEVAEQYLRGHYWTNAIMHGASKNELRKQIKQARKCCTKVLQDQLLNLSPKVIIASGQVAADSLNDLGVLQKRWKDFRKVLSQ